jgi:hypothetical protein
MATKTATARDSVWTGATFGDPSGRLMLTVLDVGSRGGWLYVDGVALAPCAPLPCDAPLEREWGDAASGLEPGRRYQDVGTGLRFRCLRSAPGELRLDRTVLNPVEVIQASRPAEICMQR